MNSILDKFVELSKLYESNGYHLYLVGGSVRDFLLNKELSDIDLVSDATPQETCSFINNVDLSFEKYGVVKYKYNDFKYDIVTLREETSYKDARHPSKIKFIKDLKVDVKRRDFTINALYMNNHFEVIDFVGGRKDLNNKTIKMVGNPSKRIKEDLLRILRAIRFSIDYDFQIDNKLEKAIKHNVKNLSLISKEKIKEELRKIKCKDIEKIHAVFEKYSILYLLDMVN